MQKDRNLKDWMDSKKLKASDVCTALGVSEQTVHHWRSNGVPSRRAQHVELFMSQWDDKEAAPTSEEDLNVIRLKISDEKFDAWTEAANRESKALIPWIIDGLDELAAEEEQQTLPDMYVPVHTPPVQSASKRANGKGAA